MRGRLDSCGWVDCGGWDDNSDHSVGDVLVGHSLARVTLGATWGVDPALLIQSLGNSDGRRAVGWCRWGWRRCGDNDWVRRGSGSWVSGDHWDRIASSGNPLLGAPDGLVDGSSLHNMGSHDWHSGCESNGLRGGDSRGGSRSCRAGGLVRLLGCGRSTRGRA